jgi:hypothetical protein
MSTAIISRTQTVAGQPKDRPASRRVLIYKIAISLTILLVGGELACRVFWMLDRKAPLLARKSMRYAYYPQLRATGVEDAAATRPEGSYDILILGGSTISEGYGPIGLQLQEDLARRLGKPVRRFNLAFAGHNSRDSMIKYRWLADQHFDLVVVYDGINDTRMNNAPPGMYREDYSHCYWYQCVNRLDKHPLLYQSALPFTMQLAAERIAQETGLVWTLPRLNPRDEWTEHGKDIRTPATFQRNLGEIVTTAKKRGERVVVMTFAYYVPADYSLDACLAGKLDYQAPTNTPVEIWGKPAYVVAALQQQNDAVRELATQHPDVVFVDQDRLLARTGKNFADCCHLTEEGCTHVTVHRFRETDGKESKIRHL